MEPLSKVVHATRRLEWLQSRELGAEELNNDGSSQAVPEPDSMQRGGEQQFETFVCRRLVAGGLRLPRETSLELVVRAQASPSERFQGARFTTIADVQAPDAEPQRLAT
jgi:hypothetical protein